MNTCSLVVAGLPLALALTACPSGNRSPQAEPPGQPSTKKTEAVKAGAEVFQSNTPADKLDIYMVGFHLLKDDPSYQMEVHHYCFQVNEDFAQCALYDSNAEDANLNGIEYIISEKLFETLPEAEKPHWHPHNYEILSGQLQAPGLPEEAEHELMTAKMNSYGKIWHAWRTGSAVTSGQSFPFGEASLGWSFNADGEAQKGLIEGRDDAMGLNTEEARRQRQNLIMSAHLQHGVDALADAFPSRQKPAGIKDARSNDATGNGDGGHGNGDNGNNGNGDNEKATDQPEQKPKESKKSRKAGSKEPRKKKG